MPAPLADIDPLLDAGSGSILAVAVRQLQGRETGSHSHAPGQLLGSLEGLLSVNTSSDNFVIPATHAVWLPPHCLHGAKSPGPFAGWSVYVAERYCATLPTSPRTVKINPLLSEAIRRACVWGRPPIAAAEHRLAAVILDEISTLPVEPLGLPLPRDPRIVRVAQAILSDLTDKRGLNAWAEMAAMSARTLTRHFTTETGFSLMEWRLRARTLRAIERLAQGESVTEIALSLGYENVSAFISSFRKTMGVSPGRYCTSRSDQLACL